MQDDRLTDKDLIWAPGTDHITQAQMDAMITRDANAIRPIPSRTVLGHEHLMADADRAALIAEVNRLWTERDYPSQSGKPPMVTCPLCELRFRLRCVEDDTDEEHGPRIECPECCCEFDPTPTTSGTD